ncbi:TPA: hypothetical protein SMR48_002006 [Pseudomonas putida]|nr:hypothetical protein [Pseudomonas putida]
MANLDSLFEMAGFVPGEALPKDFEQFVIGWGGNAGPIFIRPNVTGHPLFLLERSLDRMVTAYQSMLAGQAALEAEVT